MKTVDQTVHATSGNPAASNKETPFGMGRRCTAGRDTFSAYPPPPSKAHTCNAKHGPKISSNNLCHFSQQHVMILTSKFSTGDHNHSKFNDFQKFLATFEFY